MSIWFYSICGLSLINSKFNVLEVNKLLRSVCSLVVKYMFTNDIDTVLVNHYFLLNVAALFGKLGNLPSDPLKSKKYALELHDPH